MAKFTDKTITSLEALRAEWQETRQRGYAIDRGEHEVGSYCVGAPILDARGQVIGSCSVSGADAEIAAGLKVDLGTRVMYTAQEISRRMGYVPARPSSVAHVPHTIPDIEVNP